MAGRALDRGRSRPRPRDGPAPPDNPAPAGNKGEVRPQGAWPGGSLIVVHRHGAWCAERYPAAGRARYPAAVRQRCRISDSRARASEARRRHQSHRHSSRRDRDSGQGSWPPRNQSHPLRPHPTHSYGSRGRRPATRPPGAIFSREAGLQPGAWWLEWTASVVPGPAAASSSLSLPRWARRARKGCGKHVQGVAILAPASGGGGDRR
jgi:hypothetical protein